MSHLSISATFYLATKKGVLLVQVDLFLHSTSRGGCDCWWMVIKYCERRIKKIIVTASNNTAGRPIFVQSMGKEKRGSKFSADGPSSKRTASRIELAKRRKGKSGHASGLEALLSLANAAEIEEEPPLKEKRRSELESEGKGTKRSRPQLQLQRKKCPLKSERNGNTKDTTISGAPHGPGFCAVGCAPTIEKAKHCLRHTAIAYFIYYQQRKSMTQCVSPGGKTAAHVSLDPTLEARLLKERTKWMKNTKPNYLQSASIENETSLEAATSSMAYFDNANKGQQEASDGMHRHQAVKLVGERQQYLGSEHQQQPTVGVGYYRYQQLRPSKEATAHGEDERHYQQQQPTYERVARPLSSSVDRLHRPVLNNHSLGSHSVPMYMSSPMARLERTLSEDTGICGLKIIFQKGRQLDRPLGFYLDA
eukprot:jgi/Bigna1/86348/estExt_fgenesh1_pg.C_90353